MENLLPTVGPRELQRDGEGRSEATSFQGEGHVGGGCKIGASESLEQLTLELVFWGQSMQRGTGSIRHCMQRRVDEQKNKIAVAAFVVA